MAHQVPPSPGERGCILMVFVAGQGLMGLTAFGSGAVMSPTSAKILMWLWLISGAWGLVVVTSSERPLLGLLAPALMFVAFAVLGILDPASVF